NAGRRGASVYIDDYSTQNKWVQLPELPANGFLLVGAGTRQHPFHRVIAFIAGVFDEGPLGPLERDLAGPGLRERRGVGNRELVHNGVRRSGGEALDQAHILTRPLEADLVVEVGGL